MKQKPTRNKFEDKIASQLPAQFAYEQKRLSYTKLAHYLPDWVDDKAKIIIEGKGRFTGADRTKMKSIKAAYPEYKIIMCLQTPQNKIGKSPNSKTYEEWCVANEIIPCTLQTLQNTLKEIE